MGIQLHRLQASRPVSLLARVIGIVVLNVLLVWAGRAVIPAGYFFTDYICYWAAGTNVLSGQSPRVDIESPTRVQKAFGWDKTSKGLGIYDFLPFYYPPWFAFLCAGFCSTRL